MIFAFSWSSFVKILYVLGLAGLSDHMFVAVILGECIKRWPLAQKKTESNISPDKTETKNLKFSFDSLELFSKSYLPWCNK